MTELANAMSQAVQKVADREGNCFFAQAERVKKFVCNLATLVQKNKV
jgi:hypothetical protein